MSLLAAAGPYTLTKTWYVDGTPTDVGAVTIGVVDGNGDTVVASGTATTNNTDGTYSYTLADQPNPDQLKVTWTRSDTGADLVDHLEVIGARLFTEAQLREFRTADGGGLSQAKFPDAVVHTQREVTRVLFEDACGQSFVPRYCRADIAGTGTRRLPLYDARLRLADGTTLNRPGRHHRINRLLSVTVDDNPVDVSDVDIDGPVLVRTDGHWTAPTSARPLNVTVAWVYGHPTPPTDIAQAAIVHARYELATRDFQDRVYAVEGTRLSTPGPGRPTGIPYVDGILNRYDARVAIA